jgi:4-hydroxythreonine-4-phosphate dehydrogenase
MNKPLIAVTMGDPAGIGPEIVARTLVEPEAMDVADVVVTGDARIMQKAIEITKVPVKLNCIKSPKECVRKPGVMDIIDMENVDLAHFAYGKVNGMCGKAAYAYIAKAIELANAHEVAAVATTPINKESLRAGGIPYIGHTEIFGALTNTPDPLTMFECKGLRVFFLTRHVSLLEMLGMIKKDRIKDYVRRCTEALKKLGVTEGTMAVAGLNPHSGEHGLFGWDEVNVIAPAVKELQDEGFNVAGPVPADSVFHQAYIGKYNSVLSLYHDQGHIATKTLDFERTISVTNGMPILRTSVDHGTAFDIAGKGIASAVSMAEAVRLAAQYAPAFNS